MAIKIIKTNWVRFLYLHYCLGNSYDCSETASYCVKSKASNYILGKEGIEACVGSLVTLIVSAELDATRFEDYWVPKLVICVPKVKSTKKSVIVFRSSAHFLRILSSTKSVKECPYLFW